MFYEGVRFFKKLVAIEMDPIHKLDLKKKNLTKYVLLHLSLANVNVLTTKQ
jgi:hypothetical protein